MEIKVERIIEEGKLVFTITCENPSIEYPNENGWEALNLLNICESAIEATIHNGFSLKQEIKTTLFGCRDMVFDQIHDFMTFALRERLEPKFEHMCNEIYNWQYDNASGRMKQLLQEFDPQRTKYYFDNDKTPESDGIEQEDNLEGDEFFEGS